MASIPLLALSVHAPQPDVAGSLGQAISLQDLMQRRKLIPGQLQAQQQQLQAGEMENQQKAQQLKDSQVMATVLSKWEPQSDTSGQKLAKSFVEAGGSGQGAMAIQQKMLERQKALSDIAKSDAETGAKQLETKKGQNDLLAGKIGAIAALPDEQLAQGISELSQNLDPQHAQVATQLAQSNDPQKMRQGLTLLQKGYMGETAQIEEALKTAQTASATATTRKTNIESSALEQSGGLTPQQQESRYRLILGKVQSGQPTTSEEMTFAKSYEAANKKTTTSSDSLGITSTNTSGPSGLAAVSRGKIGGGTATASANGTGTPGPGSLKNSIVDELGQYKADPAMLSRMFLKHPELIGMVQQKYPDWDQTTYQAKSALIKGYTSGMQSKEINAINTAMGHISDLDNAVDALHNHDLTLLNKIGTAYNINIAGKTPEAAFELIARRVGPEITGAYIPGGGGQGERIANEKDFDVNLPPQTLHNNAAITVKMLRSKIGALENQYKNTVGRDDFTQRFITPEAQASLQRFAPQASKSQSGGFNWGNYQKVK